MSATKARVDMEIQNNATWEDAFQFGTAGDTSWSFSGQNFLLEVKTTRASTVVLLTLSSANGRIVIDDATLRVLHFNVDDATLAAALIPGCYVYDLIMFDASVPPVRIVLMGGNLKVCQGVTGN